MIKLQLPQKEIAGVSLNNHMLLAAGVLGTTASSLNRMLENGIPAELRSGRSDPVYRRRSSAAVDEVDVIRRIGNQRKQGKKCCAEKEQRQDF